MKILSILLMLIFSQLSFSQASNPNDTLKIGQGSSSSDKGLIFDTGDDASNKKLTIEKTSKLLKFDGNQFQLGDGALTESKELIFNGTSGKSLKYDHTNTEFLLNDDLGISAGQKLKTNSIDSISGTETAVEQDLRAKGNLYLGASGTVQLRENAGKLEFSNDGSIYKKVGSGGGGAGALSILENNGFEDGISSGWSFTVGTVTAITGSSALVGETSAQFDPTSQNDYHRTDYITVIPGLRGSACEARFLYTGFDRNVYASVETESGVVLGRFQEPIAGVIEYGLPAHASAGYESIFYKCPTEADITTLATNGNLRLVLYQGTVTDAAPGIYDDVHFGGLIGLTETTTPDILSAKISSTGVVTSESVDFINGNCSKGGTGLFSCTFNSGFFTVTPSVVANASDGAQGRYAHVSGVGTSTLNIRTYAHAVDNTIALDVAFDVVATKQGADAKQSVQVYKGIPRISKNTNSFNAKVSASGAVTGENIDWLNGDASISSTSVFSLPIISGTFAAAPTCNCNVYLTSATTAAGRVCTVTSTSTTSITYLTERNSTTNEAYGVHLNCNKSGSDFGFDTMNPIIIGQVTNSIAESAFNNVRIESCFVGGGTGTLASGDCTGWINSLAHPGTGQYNLTLKSVFSENPTCTATVGTGSTNAVNVQVASSSLSAINMKVQNHDATAADLGFHLICIGKR